MVNKKFDSKISKDSIEIIYFDDFKKAQFHLIKFDNLEQNTKLVSTIVIFLKKNNIDWLTVKFKKYYTVSKNIKHHIDKNNVISCSIDNFEQFYIDNLKNLIDMSNISIDDKQNNTDEWITITNVKKQKKQTLTKALDQINSINQRWV